ncbi:hypothetical protein ETU08_00080 [Apibacter muscae]|uniref:Uncharacterized protein n=1 Tax=Apibacter muscae TaxID=2509004 RepID=A0A563DDZ2_9FLAO|nr:hypothetical protein [Apibacter muscae]TWP28435.1 hypothetical protein ETU09_05790 [Apibacter muscae]TWP31891.1 hypothetical protein ETU08_00080 [Apibacter muscae]
MPIISITQQPEVSSLNAAYKPIVFKVLATENNSSNKPPVVYCDVYIDDVYYKTFSKTINIGINGGSFEYLFDIQDIKELLEYNLPTINGNTIQQMTNTLRKVFVKFRNAYKDNNGFIISEQKAPIQGTSNKKPISGEGLISNTFYILNSLIQQEEKQDLSELLNSYKTDEWDINTFPLTKRPKNIYLKKTESSFFPIITDKTPYKICIEVTYFDNTTGVECIKVENMNIDEIVGKIKKLEDLTSILKKGTILLFNKTAKEIPDGWEEYTPLRGRSPIGLDPNDPDFNTIGQPVGSKTHTLKKENLPPMSLSLKDIQLWGVGAGSSHSVLRQTIGSQFPIEGGGGISKEINHLDPHRIVTFIIYKGE